MPTTRGFGAPRWRERLHLQLKYAHGLLTAGLCQYTEGSCALLSAGYRALLSAGHRALLAALLAT